MALVDQRGPGLERDIENGAADFCLDRVSGAVCEAQRDVVRLIVHEA
jgi:K+-transporting ATPase c subunit